MDLVLLMACAILQAIEMNMSLPPQPVLPALGDREQAPTCLT